MINKEIKQKAISLRKKNNSYREISKKLKITFQSAWNICHGMPKHKVNLIDINFCRLKCNCGWNITIGGLNKYDYSRILSYIQNNFEVNDIVDYSKKITPLNKIN